MIEAAVTPRPPPDTSHHVDFDRRRSRREPTSRGTLRRRCACRRRGGPPRARRRREELVDERAKRGRRRGVRLARDRRPSPRRSATRRPRCGRGPRPREVGAGGVAAREAEIAAGVLHRHESTALRAAKRDATAFATWKASRLTATASSMEVHGAEPAEEDQHVGLSLDAPHHLGAKTPRFEQARDLVRDARAPSSVIWTSRAPSRPAMARPQGRAGTSTSTERWIAGALAVALVAGSASGPLGRLGFTGAAGAGRASRLATQVVDDLAERAQRGHLGGLHLGQPRGALAHGGEDLDALDGVDPEVGLELHGEREHLGGVAGLLGDDAEHQRFELLGRGAEPGQRGAVRRRDGRGRGEAAGAPSEALRSAGSRRSGRACAARPSPRPSPRAGPGRARASPRGSRRA
jgi:hypothetical protein